jgi:hypothetical protein
LRRREDISWIAALLRVIRAGGEIPEGDGSLCGCLLSCKKDSLATTRRPVLKPNSDDEFLSYDPESNVVLNGQSKSFVEGHVAYRKSSQWSYVSGVENETREPISVLYNPEAEAIYYIMYARDISISSDVRQPVSSLKSVSGLPSIDE